MQLPEHFLQKVRCPHCIKAGAPESSGVLHLAAERWLVCHSCQRKYPIVEAVPTLTIQEGEKWIGTAVTALPAAQS